MSLMPNAEPAVEERTPPRVALTSNGIARRPFLETLLGAPFEVHRSPGRLLVRRYTAVAGWGLKRSGQVARDLAMRQGLPCWLLEDGFLRSAGDGADRQALSIVIDDIGIYYDARQPSRLEQLIARGCPPAELQRTRSLIQAWREQRLSKYNHVRDARLPHGRYVLVIDQTAGDASIAGALATSDSFRGLLEAALDENPSCRILLKVHPDVLAGRKTGHVDSMTAGAAARVEIVANQVHAPDLIEAAEAVYTVSSQIGFEALLWGRKVRTFGMPFYAGWRLTSDRLAAADRRGPRSLEDLVYASLVAYPRYVNPETGRRCEVESVVDHVALQRRMRARLPESIHALGFSRWKRPIARAFFAGSRLTFVSSARQIKGDAMAVAVWGSRPRPSGLGADRPLIRVEDGFVRSVGLGAALIKPSSWVLDDIGIYYDARSPSRLEDMLERMTFEEKLLERAANLRRSIVSRSLSKYNLGGPTWQRPDTRHRVALVAGQVEGDASLIHGGIAFQTNLELLQAVRRLEPECYIVYKPHPDVVSGLRVGAVPQSVSDDLCDEVLDRHSVIDVIREVDTVHVNTSLTGFEALLHGKEVKVHGMPFYAGWGLTTDYQVAPRRRRHLTLDMLVAATLIQYPTYVSETSGRFTTPERVLLELDARRSTGSASARTSTWLTTLMRLASLWRNPRLPARYLDQ